ncbi:DUF969 domain-containing protein [Ahniella affigens]|uniref:DUF969 domain-containing protein n=1 Tax=Ahniella affigens TaxID=2021234 RepID=A0A2P1PVF4_9GAMM|nr:DUF969 family protein [Ahniella affigens]AVP98835.1 DUF969 domain-containing protein [Ahniella affigens]
MNFWPALGLLVLIAGLALRLQPMLTVLAAGLVSGLAGGMSIVEILETLGAAFTENRFLAILILTLPAIALLERLGLRQEAERLIRSLKRPSFARVLIPYLAVRQIFAMLGLTSIAGHPQTVRPILAPMAEAAVAAQTGKPLTAETEAKVRAHCAGTDNIGLFFGEDVFVAFGAVLLIQSTLAQQGIDLAPFAIAIYGLPTAFAAFAIQSTRLWFWSRRFDRIGAQP